ncbi:conserved hypothetical protein [Ricinus communis]|uniref:Uncharacterized protein n=1 Tax=Ricinus communis TaxID=3988 RepID=B9SJ68_RICCO|nr:conserved hypothetical protein [Ricinus communis]
MNISSCSITEAELWGLYQGLAIAWDGAFEAFMWKQIVAVWLRWSRVPISLATEIGVTLFDMFTGKQTKQQIILLRLRHPCLSNATFLMLLLLAYLLFLCMVAYFLAYYFFIEFYIT